MSCVYQKALAPLIVCMSCVCQEALAPLIVTIANLASAHTQVLLGFRHRYVCASLSPSLSLSFLSVCLCSCRHKGVFVCVCVCVCVCSRKWTRVGACARGWKGRREMERARARKRGRDEGEDALQYRMYSRTIECVLVL